VFGIRPRRCCGECAERPLRFGNRLGAELLTGAADDLRGVDLVGAYRLWAGADTEAEGRVSFPDALPDPADQEVGCREVTSAALIFLLLT
jgi:hypothetical protein